MDAGMLFNSLDYLLFLPTVVVLYFLTRAGSRWILLLGASYYFYASRSPEHAVLMLTVTVVAYLTGLGLGFLDSSSLVARRGRQVLTIGSVAVLLGILFAFKYLEFATNAWMKLVAPDNAAPDYVSDLVLPVGISFYTFQAIGYVLDVSRNVLVPEKRLGIFATYIAFFPQLVAGPIERAKRLLPQLKAQHRFELQRLKSGLMRILWGMFKKVVIADRLGIYVDEVYESPHQYSGLQVWVATYFFAFQIYCDFSAYSDIAVGSARILGIDLMENFRCPYFAPSVREFWQRWHISLSTWFRDYVYLTMGGNRVSRLRWYANVMVVFAASALWHGANLTFVYWGALHGVYFICGDVSTGLRRRAARALGLRHLGKFLPLLRTCFVFHLVTLGWIFFRANSLSDALTLLDAGSRIDLGQDPLLVDGVSGYEFVVSVVSLLCLETLQYQTRVGGFDALMRWPAAVRWPLTYALVLFVLVFGCFSVQEFIYFQF